MCGMSHSDSDLVSFSTLPKSVRAEYKTQLFNFLSGLETWYPDFPQWYVRLFAGDDLAAGREIFLCIHAGKIAGVIILKKSDDEKKICTIRVAPQYQRRGIGTKLMETGIRWLSCEKPLITVNEKAFPQYEKLLSKFGFVKTQETPGYYVPELVEYVYNGKMEPQR